jgi:hypothetical protein
MQSPWPCNASRVYAPARMDQRNCAQERERGCYFSPPISTTASPDTGSVTPSPPPRSSSISRMVSSVLIISGTGRGNRVHAVPFTNDAVAALTGLDQGDFSHAGKRSLQIAIRLFEVLFTSQLNAISDNVVRSHGKSPYRPTLKSFPEPQVRTVEVRSSLPRYELAEPSGCQLYVRAKLMGGGIEAAHAPNWTAKVENTWVLASSPGANRRRQGASQFSANPGPQKRLYKLALVF